MHIGLVGAQAGGVFMPDRTLSAIVVQTWRVRLSKQTRRYLILARFSQTDIIPARASLMESAAGVSVEEPLLAFSSEQGDTVGVLVRSEMVSAQIIYSLANDYMIGDQTFIFVMGVDEDWSGVGAQASWEWLREGRGASAPSEGNTGYQGDIGPDTSLGDSARL